MSAQSIDWARAAVLIMDYQNDILSTQSMEKQELLLGNAAEILAESRKNGLPIIYIVVRFRDGYPEVCHRNKMFTNVKGLHRLIEGTPGGDIHSSVSPLPSELVVTKRRVGAFSTTELDAILRAKDISTLILFGISTSGVVLSTVRWAADMDYSLVVISDACSDQDDEVHRVLTEKVFPRQATVITTQDFIATLNS
jgi:nicotinamidase-related amidase